jgi:hypothetical protein
LGYCVGCHPLTLVPSVPMMGIMCNPRAIKEIAIRPRPGTPLSRQAKNHESTPEKKTAQSSWLAPFPLLSGLLGASKLQEMSQYCRIRDGVKNTYAMTWASCAGSRLQKNVSHEQFTSFRPKTQNVGSYAWSWARSPPTLGAAAMGATSS